MGNQSMEQENKMSKEKKLAKGCVVFMKASSGLTGYGNGQCVSEVCEELGTVSLYGHNQHYKTYDIDRIAEYPLNQDRIAELEAELAKANYTINKFGDYGCYIDDTPGIHCILAKANRKLEAELAAQESLIAKHVVNGLTYADRVHGLQDELAKFRWIPASERLPTLEDRDEHSIRINDGTVNVLGQENGISFVANYYPKMDVWNGFTPTIWMPIPPLPTTKRVSDG